MLALSSGVKIIWLSLRWLWGTDGGRILSARFPHSLIPPCLALSILSASSKNKSSEDQHKVNMAPPRDQLKLPAKIIEELGGKGMYISNPVPKIE